MFVNNLSTFRPFKQNKCKLFVYMLHIVDKSTFSCYNKVRGGVVMLNLKKIREEKGISQATAARELNISRQTYNNYELGKREADYGTLLKFAEYFGTTVDNLISNKSNEKDYSNETKIDSDEIDQNLIILNRNAKKMTPEQRKQLIDIAKIIFKEDFD